MTSSPYIYTLMFKKILSPDPFKTFYVVFTYIIVFSFWWGYLLYAKNETAFTEEVELNEQRYQQTNQGENYRTTKDFAEIKDKYERQKLMIITEGSVFFILLFAGLIIVRRVFKREIELARLQRNFLLSITHELKSPLSTIKLSLQTMLRRKLEPQQSEKLMNNSLMDLDRLEALVDNILFAAKIERDEPGFSDEELNISDVLLQITDRFSTNKKAIALNSQIDADIYLQADPMAFTSVVINLIENAIKYSEPQTSVVITLSEAEDRIVLAVADTGSGIPETEKKKVFDKFYRIGNEDTRKTKGTGLGLYIVKRFVEIYRGTITITDNFPQGSIFTLEFPK